MPTKQELYAQTDIALHEGRLADARSSVETLMEDSKDAVGFTLAGRVSAAEGDPVGGLAYLGEAIRLEPFFEPAYRFRALIHEQLGDSVRMMSDLRSLLLYHPTDLPMITTYVDQALRSKRYDAAAKVIDAAIRRAPRVAELHNMRGLILQRGGDMEASVAAYRCGIALKPDDTLTLNNLGTVLHSMDRSEEAEQAFHDALRESSDFAMAWYNLGNVLKDTLRFEEAISCYERAITLRPDYADAHLNLGCVLLQHREWERGWAEYEWRWRVPDLIPLAKVEIPRWTGEPLEGRRILILAEQGNGDTLQFSRYLPLLRRLGAEVSMRCPQEVASLISRIPGAEVHLMHEAIPLPPFDFHAPLMSLPALLNGSYEEIPNLPYLVTEARRRAYFAKKLGTRKAGRVRIGIVWGGNPEQMDDHHRSAPLDQLSELWEIEGVRWISLQKGGHQKELAESGYPIEDWSSELDTYDDSAALLQELDGFVSVCSSPLHLAGALGVRSVGMLCWASDWRWQRETSETPWYPSVTLVRQPERNDWRSVAAQVKSIVSEWEVVPVKRGMRRLAGKEVAPSRVPPTVRAITADGKLDIFLNDLFLTPVLLTHGEYCQGEITLLSRFLKPGALIVEAGGNVGAHTLPLARIVGSQGHIHTFEPQIEANLLLRSNVESAELGNITVHAAALSDSVRGLLMERPSYSSVWNTGGLAVHQELGEPIDAVTIDSLQLEHCELIKLDVEGHERKALMGARATIERFRPILFVEDDRIEESLELRKLILSLGYRCYRHRATLANCSLIPLEQRQNLGTYVSVSVLGLPKEYPVLTDLIEIDEHLNIIPNRL